MFTFCENKFSEFTPYQIFNNTVYFTQAAAIEIAPKNNAAIRHDDKTESVFILTNTLSM